jgi:hypothetical protein
MYWAERIRPARLLVIAEPLERFSEKRTRLPRGEIGFSTVLIAGD